MSVNAKKSVAIQGGSQRFRQNLKDCWTENVLCDVVLISKSDSRRVPAQRIILAAASDYFKTMFTGKMKESEEKEIALEMPGDVLEALVKYFYSDIIELDEQYAKDLYAAAHLMQLDEVATECFDFLLSNLNSTNCFELLFFAESNEYDTLLEKTQTFILKEFETIYKGTGFLEVDFDYLLNLLQQDDLVLRDEEVVFLAVQRWVNHNNEKRMKHKDALMEHVHLPHLKPEFLFDVVKSFCNTEKTKEAYLKAVEYHLLPSRRDKMGVNKFRPKPVNALLAVSSFPSNKDFLQIEAFDSLNNKWHKLNTTIPWRRNFAMTEMGENLIIVGGENYGGLLNSVISIDLTTLDWKYLAPMNKAQDNCRAVVCKGKLYTINWNQNFTHGDNHNYIERWDPSNDKWTCITTNNYSINDCTVLNDNIYTVGWNPCGYLEICRFDTVTNSFVSIKNIQNCGVKAYLIGFNHHLYIFTTKFRAFCYNLNDTVTELTRMTGLKNLTHPAIFNNEIFVGQCRDKTLLKYNAVAKVWTKMSPCNDSNIAHMTSCQLNWNQSKIIRE